MKREHFSEEQIVTALKRVDSGESTATVSRELGMSYSKKVWIALRRETV